MHRLAVEGLILADVSDPGHARIAGVVEADRLRRPTGAGGDAERIRGRRAAARTGHGGHVERVTDVGLDVEVEVDTDPLEEGVVEADEPNLDRHLEILETAELLEEIGDLVVHFLRLADNDAQVRRERLDRSLAADRVPGLRGDGVLDQIDERREVGLGTAGR